MSNTLSIYGSHDSGACYIDKTGKLRILEYERFVQQRYAAFSSSLQHRPGLGTTDIDRELFLRYIKNDCSKIDTVVFNELNADDINHINKFFPNVKFKKKNHHFSHAACGYFQSPFDEAIILSVDGGGYDDNTVLTTAVYHAKGDKIDFVRALPLNLGVPYSAIGYPIKDIKPGPDCDKHSLAYAGKVMGLCAYGQIMGPWISKLENFYKNNQSIEQLGKSLGLDLSFNSLIGQDAYDLARTSQYVFEELLLNEVTKLVNEFNLNIVLVGGCALNVLANQHIAQYLNFHKKELFIPPNPNDCGLALGQYLTEHPIKVKDIAYNGLPLLDKDYLETYVLNYGAEKVDVKTIVNYLLEGKLIGIVEGDSEVGPRALGNRSIIAYPRYPSIKDTLNSKVKFREWFRPFAPVAFYGDAMRMFHNVFYSPFMSYAPQAKEWYKDIIPSVIHNDSTARLQTIDHPGSLVEDILIELNHRGSLPILLNTSFNIKGLPILSKISDALTVLETTELDYVIIEGYLFKK